MASFEVEQAIGQNARFYYGVESDWGVASVATTFKQIPMIPGESLKQNIAQYESQIVRPTRSRIASVLGTQSPGGDVMFELGAVGMSEMWWHLLGGTPVASGTGSQVATILGANSLPEGFALEKGFTDVALYYKFLGCKVNSMTLNLAVNAIVGGSLNIMARQLVVSSTSMTNGQTVTDLIPSQPFTCQSAILSEGSTLAAIATCQNLTLTIDNRINGDNFVIGSPYRANLKPGKRLVNFTGTFLFADDVLLNKARNGTSTKLQIILSDGVYQQIILLPNVRLFESGGTPTVSTDQGLTLQIQGESIYDATVLSDIQVQLYGSQTAANITAI